MKRKKLAITHEQQGRILIVDDDEDFVFSILDILESRGYQVEIAHGVQSGWKKAQTFDAQVALLDIRLGDGSGIDLINRLQEVHPEILCVMITAFAAMDTAIEAIHEGAYAYLQKPLDIRYLLITLGRCFEKIRLRDEKAAAERALRARNRALDLLNTVSQELTSTLDRFQITDQLLQRVTEIVGAEGASVWLWEEEQMPSSQSSRETLQDAPQDWLVCRAVSSHHNQKSSPLNMRVRPDQGVVGWVVQHGKSTIAPYAPDDARFLPDIDEQTGLQTRSLLAVPLWVRSKVIGALEVMNKRKGDFDEQDMALTETLAASAAIAIDNAQLIEALGTRTQELQARNEDLDAYAHTVAHDLKGPLGHIVGFAHALEEIYAELPEDELRRYLRTIAQSGRKMSNIIDELLLLAGLRDAKVETKPLDMARIVQESQERLDYMIQEYQADVILPPAKAWPAALGYGPWVEEVWVNYLSNALKYGGRPPRVELGFDAVESGDFVVSAQSNEWVVDSDHSPPATNPYPLVRFWVRDNGLGLTSEEQGRLFKSFERLDQVRVKGHGLGLSIVRRIVEKLGGQVGVESEISVGSTFWFVLPTQPQDA
jgi:signal transduction histidine kinase/ActR/RegA family two-component response regulator